MNGDIRAKFLAAAAAQQLTAIDVTAANFKAGQAAFRQNLLGAIESMAEIADYAYWPNEGRYVVVSPAVFNLIRAQLVADKLLLVTGITDRAYTDNVLPPVYGFSVIKDNSMGDGGKENTDDDEHAMYFGVRGRGIAHARQVRQLDTFRDRVYMGTSIQGLFSWGTVVSHPELIRVQKLNIT